MYYCSELPQESEDPLSQDMGPEYFSDKGGDGPDSSDEYVPLDGKAKRRLIQQRYNKKRKKQMSEAKLARRKTTQR